MRVALASEVNVLAEAINRISEQNRHTRDFTLNTSASPCARSSPVSPSTAPTPSTTETVSRDRPPLHRARGRAGEAPQPGIGTARLRLRPRRVADARPGTPERRAAGRTPPLRDALPATHRSGDGEGAGGHGPLHRTTASSPSTKSAVIRPPSASRSRISTSSAWSAESAGRTPCSPPPPTTPNGARTSAPGSSCPLGAPAEWRAALNRWRRLNRKHKRRDRRPPRPAQRRVPRSTRPCSAPGPSATSARRRSSSNGSSPTP